MTVDVQARLAQAVKSAQVRPAPYPHLFIQNIFPTPFYDAVQASIPAPDALLPIGQVRPVSGYNERFLVDLSSGLERLTEDQRTFWHRMARTLRDGIFRRALLERFKPALTQRFSGQTVTFRDEVMLVQDITKYSLGPHTDAINKVITVLFYLPADCSLEKHGTSIYQPKDSSFRCPGGPHHTFDGFERVATMPFVPNSMFAFVKGDRSFHGVEPVTDPNVRRWLLLYDIKLAS